MRHPNDYDRFEGREFSYPEPMPDDEIDARIDDMKIKEADDKTPFFASRVFMSATAERIEFSSPGDSFIAELLIYRPLTPVLAEEIGRALKELTNAELLPQLARD